MLRHFTTGTLFIYPENLYSFDTYIWAKMGDVSYCDPIFLFSKSGKMYSYDPFDHLRHFESMGGAERPIQNERIMKFSKTVNNQDIRA